MLILINPLGGVSLANRLQSASYLVEICLQEVNLLGVLQKAWPELLLELRLSQYKLDILCCVVDLALLGVNLCVKLKLEVIGSLKRVRVTGKGKRRRLEVKL